METRQLEVFLAVVGTGTFAGAADELGTVQSNISTTIRALEQDLGLQLFDRSGRTARLTTAGRVLAEETPAWLHLATTCVSTCWRPTAADAAPCGSAPSTPSVTWTYRGS